MTKIAGAGLALSLSLGLTGCTQPSEATACAAGPSGDGQYRSIDLARRAMNRCGLTTADLYMIRFDSMPGGVMRGLHDVPRDEAKDWLAQYRATHEEDLSFMLVNPQELTRPADWTDLRYLTIRIDGSDTNPDGSISDRIGRIHYVSVDFDAGMVYFSTGMGVSLEYPMMHSVSLNQDKSDALVRLLSEVTLAWPYPDINVDDPIPNVIIPNDIMPETGGWKLAIVTRDKNLYRFDQTTGRPIAPPGFIEVYNALEALTVS